MGKDNNLITHLQFAENTVIFVPNDSKKLHNFKRLLQCFSLMTGLEINFEKSSLISWGVDYDWVERMSIELGCKSEKLPFTYLGMIIGVSSKRKKFLDLIIQRIEQRLVLWKSKLLSTAGRSQLIKNSDIKLTYLLSLNV